ncbi:hypothetical protein BD289DRAFT_366970 [Coniella lustricola]|uniref:EGF-like domain-containing protein n=1 Tax=Coniella lustricola TaxID=2025994 RepID=A0A2T3AA78_9PEZI|nr:hypothetical protein BD289DRAFT_366970 [Coniella lustricola]
MDRPSTSDIIRRARERAEAGLPREDYDTIRRRQAAVSNNDNASPSTPDIPPRARPPLGSPDGSPTSQPSQMRSQRPQAPPGFQDKDGQIALPISRPAPVPQWPLTGPLATPTFPSNNPAYRPPAGSQPPMRPPRPSQVPSILDASKLQDPTPTFQYQPPSDTDSGNFASSVPETPSTYSRPSTYSSVASIPDFPMPIQLPMSSNALAPRRSVNLGPPPSARRGATSFYSHLSYVSPIPEESPRSRSRASYASSAAMPDSWGTPSPMSSPRNPEDYLNHVIIEERSPSPSEGASVRSVPDDDGDESRLVRNASVGRRGRANLVTTGSRNLDAEGISPRPGASPVQRNPFADGTVLLGPSPETSSGTVPSARSAGTPPAGVALTADQILNAYDAASAVDPRASRRMSSMANAQTPRGFARLSALRRPPRLNMDAVREAEQRGSLTSLPDLIRRATRLAASLDRGTRPASRFDMDDYPYYDDKHRSGLSDMLAAFPPPAQAQSRNGVRQSFRDSILSWPLPPTERRFNNEGATPDGSAPNSPKKGRRCCGLPLWGFILIAIVLVVLVAAAIIIPIEFFVIRKANATSASTTAAAEQQCQTSLTCQNGGTNVVVSGICSCICANGFTGFDCSTSDTAGCTTTTISGDANISNVTLGDAIPRLLTQASSNFSISLSETTILSKLNANNLSCSSQNALVTFDGEDSRVGAATDTVTANLLDTASNQVVEIVEQLDAATVTIMAGPSSTTTLTVQSGTTSIAPTTTVTITKTLTTDWSPSSTTASSSTSTTATATSTAATATSTSTFSVTQEVLDFARVGVLYVLQQEALSNATIAQSAIENFLVSNGQTIAAASNISLSGGSSIDLVNFHIDVGAGLVGKLVTSTAGKRGLYDPGIGL